MRNGLETRCRENQNTYFTFNNFFFENPTVCEIILKNAVEKEPEIASQYGA